MCGCSHSHCLPLCSHFWVVAVRLGETEPTFLTTSPAERFPDVTDFVSYSAGIFPPFLPLSLPPSLPTSLPPSLPLSLSPSLPPFLPPPSLLPPSSLPPSLPPSLPHSLPHIMPSSIQIYQKRPPTLCPRCQPVHMMTKYLY